MRILSIPKVIVGSILCVSVIGILSQQAGAINQELYDMNNILFYNPDAEVCTNATGNASADLSNVPDPWNSLISNTASKYPEADPRLVAATLYIENRGWPDYDKNWATSSAGAAGPWQFISSTWNSMGTDGDGDGVKDRNNPEDAVHAAFKHQNGSAGKPIIEGYDGSIEAGWNLTFKRDRENLLSFMASYNGSGAPNNTALSDFPRNENSDYVRMAYYVLASNFTQTWDTSTGEPKLIGEDSESGTASASGASSGGGCPSGTGSGAVNSDGFSFPVGGIPKDQLGNNSLKWPCPTSCHHDGSGAFDIFDLRTNQGTSNDSYSVGKPVYAIEDATINRVRSSYKGIAGCNTIALEGASGWKYWYGHIQEASVKGGQTVKAGEQVAVIGVRKCTGNGSLPHLHIDRGPSIGESGGNQGANASETLVPIINKLYEELQQ